MSSLRRASHSCARAREYPPCGSAALGGPLRSSTASTGEVAGSGAGAARGAGADCGAGAAGAMSAGAPDLEAELSVAAPVGASPPGAFCDWGGGLDARLSLLAHPVTAAAQSAQTAQRRAMLLRALLPMIHRSLCI